jgi:hypothetical protein
MSWLPSKSWTDAGRLKYSAKEIESRKIEELRSLIKPTITAYLSQHENCRYFLIEQEASSTMLQLPVFKTLLAATGARSIILTHSQFEGGSRTSNFLTNIPEFILGPLMNGHVNGITKVVKDAIEYHRSTNDLLQFDVIESMILYLDSVKSEASSSITDSGCQHTCLNTSQWCLLSKDGNSFGAKGYFGKATNIETGACAAVARDIRGKEVLLVMNSVGLVQDRASLIDPYQLMDGGCTVEHVMTNRCPKPYILKGGIIIPLGIGKDITLDISYPTKSQIKTLPRLTLTADEPWSRADYMMSQGASATSIHVTEVSEDGDSDTDDSPIVDTPTTMHSLPSKIWWFLDPNVRRRTEKATTAFIARRKGNDILINRKANKPSSGRRINDAASHDTIFSTVPAKGCGSTMIQIFSTRKSKVLFGVPMSTKSQVLPATQDFFIEVGIPTSLRSDNAKENHSETEEVIEKAPSQRGAL